MYVRYTSKRRNKRAAAALEKAAPCEPFLDHVKLTALRTTRKITRRSAFAHLCNVWGVAREVKVQNKDGTRKIIPERQIFSKNSLIVQDYHVAHTLTGWLDTRYLPLMSS